MADGEGGGGIKALHESFGLERRVGGGGLVEGECWSEHFEWEGITEESIPADERECWCAGADEEPVTVENDCVIVGGEGGGGIIVFNDSSTHDLERWEGGEILVERECWQERLEWEVSIGEAVTADEDPSVDE